MAQIFDNPLHPIDLSTAGGATELTVKNALDVLPQSFTVFLNYEATSASGRVLGEFDTVVITPTGAVIVLEVKAGDLTQDEAGQFVRNYAGEVRNINAQVESQARLIHRRLKARFPHKYLRFKHYLVLPYGNVKAVSSFNRSDIHYIDSSQFKDIAQIISRIDREPIKGETPTAGELVDFFLGAIEVAPNISALAEGQTALGNEGCEELSKWVPRIETSAAVIEVEAPAGGGKTRLAVTLLKRAVEKGEKAIYLGFNRNNIERLRNSPFASKLRFFGTWHEFAREVTHEETDPATLTDEEKSVWFEKISKEASVTLERTDILYDTIVIDGAEDFRVEWISALANALTEAGHLYILRDNFLYSEYERPEFMPQDHILVRSMESARIATNLANAMIRLGIVSPDFEGNSRIKDINFLFVDVANGDFKKATAKALQDALDFGYQKKDIALLTAHGLSTSQLIKREGLPGFTFRKPTGAFNKEGNMLFTEGEIYFDTVRRFKGLNSPCVIVTEWDYLDFGEREKSLLYLAMTRASMRLVILMTPESLQNLISTVDNA